MAHARQKEILRASAENKNQIYHKQVSKKHELIMVSLEKQSLTQELEAFKRQKQMKQDSKKQRDINLANEYKNQILEKAHRQRTKLDGRRQERESEQAQFEHFRRDERHLAQQRLS